MKMLCWAKFSDSHGLTLYDPVWLPEGENPEVGNYERIPPLDFERPKARFYQSADIELQSSCGLVIKTKFDNSEDVR